VLLGVSGWVVSVDVVLPDDCSVVSVDVVLFDDCWVVSVDVVESELEPCRSHGVAFSLEPE
jgi:hypothetical protein